MTHEHNETGWAYGVIYSDLGACGCGYAEERLDLVRRTLRACPLYEDERWRAYDTLLGEWFLCTLTNADLIEHGSSVTGSWLTDKGKRFLAVLDDEAAWRQLTDCDELVGYCECEACAR